MYWTCGQIKQNARAALAGRFWVSFGVVFLANLLLDLPAVLFPDPDLYAPRWDPAVQAMVSPLAPWQTAGYGFSLLPRILAGLFLVMPMQVGLCRYFVWNRFGNTQPELVFSTFRRGGRYGNCVFVQFVSNLFIVLWSFLLIIPGLIKALQYAFVPFLLSDNPGLDGSRAREVCRAMTYGCKGRIFLLYLSFIGWYFLAAIPAAGLDFISPLLSGLAQMLGNFLVAVYLNAALAELYVSLRDQAIAAGMILPQELNLA